jgi:prepilin-type N-terminal cleavage/methylation domain-containing protein
MNALTPSRRAKPSLAFSLIELLVVIAIISILAAMVFPITKALNRSKVRTRIKGEMAQFQTAIEAYKAKVGVYPPDNPGRPARNQLYYELLGTELTTPAAGGARFYVTLDGGSRLPADPASFQSLFGPAVSGFVNSTRGASGDEGVYAVNFLKGGLQPLQFATLPNNLRLLVASVRWPEGHPYQPVPEVKGLNPWRYVSTNPTNNAGSYDLWVDVIIDGATNRFGNWTSDPVLVNTP